MLCQMHAAYAYALHKQLSIQVLDTIELLINHLRRAELLVL